MAAIDSSNSSGLLIVTIPSTAFTPFLGALEPITYTPPLAAAYPAIKITIHRRSSSVEW
jgi:hypothetical protein